jgi:hypothetical protein
VRSGGATGGVPQPDGSPARRVLFHLEVSPIGAERARVDVLVVPVFSDERPLRAAAGRADWRLCGRLSELAARGRLRGRHGEAVLAATFGGLATPLVLALGLGARSDFDGAGVQAFAGDAVQRVLGLRLATLALPMPDATVDGADLTERVERLLFGAADALASRVRAQPVELRLILLAREEEVAKILELLRTSRTLRLPAAIALRVSDGRERPEGRGRPARPGAVAAAGDARPQPHAAGVPEARVLGRRPPVADSVK